ncbi:hypothetical protein [Modestobacter sp. NPDC049651]|uniref:hypothetical protein n=1 Tax=unclassified Modestobacter TaxID=2643866 RepID=UPI0033C29EE9
MNIRRPVAALLLALTLAGGPAVLTACSGDAAGGGTERNDGTTDDDSTSTEGADPGSTSQGAVPSAQDPANTTPNSDRDQNEDPDKG